MPGWDSYRAVYGAELRAAAREFLDHGWPVVEESDDTLMLVTGRALDVLEVPAAIGRGICAQLRAADIVVPVAATPTGSWWYPVTPGAALPAALHGVAGRGAARRGDAIAAPPSQVPDGWVHWRVPPAACDYGVARRRPDLLRRSDSSGAAGRRRQHIRAPSGPPVWSPSECGPEETADPASGSARAAAPVEARRGHPGRRRCDPATGALPPRTGSHRKRGRGRWITTDPGQYQPTTAPSGAECRRPDGGKHPTDDTAPGRFPDTWRRGPGGRTRGAPDDPDAGYSSRQALWVRDDLTNPPIGRRRADRAAPDYSGRGVRPGLRADGRRHPGEGPAEDEAGRHGPAARRRGDLPGRAVVGGQRRARLDRLRPGDGRGGHGRRAGRLVRRHRALPPPAGAADPAHGDHPDEEGRARRQPRRLRRRELPRRGRRARQARPRRGGRRGSGRGSARRPTPTGSPPSSPRPRAASSPCCATTTCRRSSSRSSSASSWRSRSARRWAPCCRGCSPTGRTTGWSTSSATAPTTGSRGNQEMVLRIVHERAPGWTPRFLDDIVADKVFAEVQNFAWAVKTDPEHPLRKAIDTFLVEFAVDLQNDPDTIERAERIKHQVVAHPDVQKFIGQAWGTVKKLILDAAEDPSSALRMRVRDGLLGFGKRLSSDPELRAEARRLARRRRGLRRAALPARDHHADHRHRRPLGRRGDLAQGRAAGGPRPAVHPDQRHGRRLAGRPRDLHRGPARSF